MRLETQVKLDNARRLHDQIWGLCFAHIKSPDGKNPLRIGALFGDFVNNLRSALNYTSVYFVESKLKPLLTIQDYNKLKPKRDFPWADSQPEFDKKLLIQHSKTHFPAVYDFLEKVQPYHVGQPWLAHLMRLSNIDKHEITIDVDDTAGTSAIIWAPGQKIQPPRPSIVGDKLLIPLPDGPLQMYQLPIYVPDFQAIAAQGGKWFVFWATVGVNQYVSVLALTDELPDRIEKLINNFEALL